MAELLIVVVGTIIAALIGLFVLSRNPWQLVNQVYAVMTLAFVVLMIANTMTTGTHSEDVNVLFFIRVVVASTTVALGALYLLVTLISNENRLPKKRRSLFVAITLLTLVVAAFDFSPYVFSHIAGSDTMVPTPAIGIAAFGSHALVFLGLSISLLVRGALRSRGQKQSQYTSIIIGLAPVLFLAPVTSFVLPFVFHKTDLIFLSPIYIVFFVASVGYSMVRHGLFDIRQAAIRTFTYILTLLTLSGIYFGLAFLIGSIFVQTGSEQSFTVNAVNVVLALILAFIFQPIKFFFDSLTKAIFYRGTYDVGELFARLTQKLSTITDLYTLLHYTTSEIATTLKAEFGAFSIYQQVDRPIFIATDNRARIPKQDILVLDDYAKMHMSSVVIADLLTKPEEKPLKRLLDSHRIALALPVIQENETKGYLFLGAHLSSHYTKRDIRALETIADELVIAVHNALSLHEVKNLNATLQQRIDNATSELRRSNAQLQRLDEAKDEFMSMASHQLRTPLTSIKGYISMLVEGDAGKVSDQQKQLLEEAFNSSERMVRLINDFLNVSRLQTGKFTLDKRPTNLSRLIEEEIEGLSQTAKSRGISFALSVPKKLERVNVDEGKIRQVVMNFSDNAIYYSKESSTIKVSLKEEAGELVFRVKDTGIGVPDEEKSKLFQKFFRAGNARRQRPDGTGIGLYLAKKVIDAHHGHVLFESEEKKGSTFGFRLPISKVKVED